MALMFADLTPEEVATYPLWCEFWDRYRLRGHREQRFLALVWYYRQGPRAYHMLGGHIRSSILLLAEVRPLMDDPLAIEVGMWYHDSFNDTVSKNNDNEEWSAHLMLKEMGHAGIADGSLVRGLQFTLATKHRGGEYPIDVKYGLDVDLAILAVDETAFDTYERQIREEYAWVQPDEKFWRGRLAILESFQKRDSVYATPFFQERYEVKAQANLARSIENLKRRLE